MASTVATHYSFSASVQRRRQSPRKNDHRPWSRLTQYEVAIQFYFTKRWDILKFVSDDLRPVSVTESRFHREPRSFSVPKHAALLDDGGARMMSLLSNVGVPAEHQEGVSRDIASAVAAQSAGTVTCSIVVILRHTEVVIQVDEMDMVLRESMNADLVKTTPATRSSIEQLEKVTYEEGLGSIDECIFCTEEFKGGLELTRLPCSHVYHRDCIVKWLEKSHLCPLCRYPLPAAN